MIKNVKIEVTPEQTLKIQKVVFDNNGSWDNKTKNTNWLIITDNGDISWGTKNTLKCYSEISAEEWLIDAYKLKQFPIYRIHESGNFIVGFDGDCSGRVVWINTNSDTTWNVGDSTDDWIKFTNSNWRDVDIDLYLVPSKTLETDNTLLEKTEYNDIKQGTIVLATRKSKNENHQDYTWQATYYGKFNEHYLVDFNGTHYQIADSISIIPTLTKKEAKQKVAELFSQPNKVTSEKIRNIIDLIKC